jgi:hypothetical protein
MLNKTKPGKPTVHPRSFFNMLLIGISATRDTNAGAGSIYYDGDNAPDGRMTWVGAVNWAAALPVGLFASPDH